MPTPQELIQKYAIGKTFADIGCMWGVNGGFSFFAEGCGAKRVVGVDIYPATKQFAVEHSRLNSSVQFVLGDINESDTLRQIGTTNIVFCSGVLYHMPDPFSLLVRLRSICDELLILRSQLVPEMPGLRNTAIFYPMLDEAHRNLFKTGIGIQKAIAGPYEPESGYDNWFWGLTPSCVELPLMKETNNPPRCRKPMPSTYPAIALSAQASARLRRDLRIMGLHRRDRPQFSRKRTGLKGVTAAETAPL